jgi:hypothetical protein
MKTFSEPMTTSALRILKILFWLSTLPVIYQAVVLLGEKHELLSTVFTDQWRIFFIFIMVSSVIHAFYYGYYKGFKAEEKMGHEMLSRIFFIAYVIAGAWFLLSRINTAWKMIPLIVISLLLACTVYFSLLCIGQSWGERDKKNWKENGNFV